MQDKQSRRLALRSIIGFALALKSKATSANDVESIVYAAADRYGVRGDILWSVALCESNGNPAAVSRRLNVNGTSDLGLFQINELTWAWWEDVRGISGDIFNAWDNADFAAWAWANGYACHWTCAYQVGWCA